MIFPKLFDQLERARWSMYEDIPWENFKKHNLSERQLHGIKMNAILEWSAMPTAEMFLRDNQTDTDFSAFISIWFFEEQKHSLVLMEYLRRFAPDFLPNEDELAAVRFKFDAAPPLDSLALHFCGEVRLNQWYRCAAEYHTEPVIKDIYLTLAADEARHARAYYRYMERALLRVPEVAFDAFTKIGLLMCNPRLNKAMHPTNLHVNKEFYPRDTVNSRLPDASWLSDWLTDEIKFDEQWEGRVTSGILGNLSSLFGAKVENINSLRRLRQTGWKASQNEQITNLEH